MAGEARKSPKMTGFGWAGGGWGTDGFYARDLKRGALALRDFFKWQYIDDDLCFVSLIRNINSLIR